MITRVLKFSWTSNLGLYGRFHSSFYKGIYDRIPTHGPFSCSGMKQDAGKGWDSPEVCVLQSNKGKAAALHHHSHQELLSGVLGLFNKEMLDVSWGAPCQWQILVIGLFRNLSPLARQRHVTFMW